MKKPFMKKHGTLKLSALIGVAALLMAGCSSSKKTTTTATTAKAATGGSGTACRDPAKNTASAPGITKDTVHIGLITSITGPFSSTFGDTADGARARIEGQNAKGGVCGRKIVLDVADDASSTTGVLTAAQSVVETKGAFAVIGYSGFMTGAIRYLQPAGVPVLGSGFDGGEWHTQPYTNMVSWSATDPTREAFTMDGEFFKKIGATNIAGLGYANPSSSASIKGLKASVEAAGLKMGYLNVSVPSGGVDFVGYVLDMKKAGVDGAVCSCVDSSNFAMFTALKQGGVTLKGALAFSGPTNNAFQSAASTDAAQGQYFRAQLTPVTLNTPATEEYQKNLTQYVPAYKGGFATFGMSGGYVSADLAIQGLIDAGQNPTRESYLTSLRSAEHSYDAHGLLATPVDLSLDKFPNEADTACAYYLQVKGNAYTLPFDKVCGTKIPGSAPK
jgi:branched-chain amino acid transport system substrate-binding protein